MPSLRLPRPARVDLQPTPSPSSSSAPRRWLPRSSAWLLARLTSLGWLRGDALSQSDRFAEFAAKALEPEEVRVELVRLASELTAASRVELFDEQNGRTARRVASWPPTIPVEHTIEGRSEPRGPIAGALPGAVKERTGPVVLQVPLRAGDGVVGVLRVTSRDRRSWSAQVVRRLETLCAIAASAERGLARSRLDPTRPGGSESIERGPTAHEASLLSAFLGFAQAQARRRHEPLSLIEVGVDRLESIRELLGDETAEAAIERVVRAVKATVRASDVVVRLEGGRIAVLLPNAEVENARMVAQAIRTSIARAGAATTTMPSLTVSIGLATYPDHAHDATTLRASAAATLAMAREQGTDQVSVAPCINVGEAGGLAHRAG